MKAPRTDLDFHLHKKQGVAFKSKATEILYGGAAGGGKSHLMRIALILWCVLIPGLQCYLFRRISGDLVKNHIEGPKGFRALLAAWVNEGAVEIVEEEIRFWNGSKIYLCHCKDEKDRIKYQGAEIHVLVIDELTHFTDVIYRFLRGRVRAIGLPKLPPEWEGMFPRILCGSNPGSIGHSWVKAAFIDEKPPLEIWRTPDEEGGMLRQYIPALLEDNPSMASDDPTYRARLRGMGSPELVKAMEFGDWEVVVGAFFSEFERRKHVIEPIELPSHWTRFVCADWGSFRPFAVYWVAVSDGELTRFPRGALIVYREWYGIKEENGRFTPNAGIKLTAEQWGAGIKAKTAPDENITYHIIDPAALAQNGGPSIAERSGLLWRPGDNTRIARNGAMGGADQFRARLVGEDDRPMLYLFNTCKHAIRTIPVLQHDEHKPEDVDTDGEDHAYDALRYGCMSRPYVRDNPAPQPVKFGLDRTINEMIEAKRRRRLSD